MDDPIAVVVETLYCEHAAKIYAYIYRRTSNRELAEDKMQETFCKLLAALRAGVVVRHSGGFLYRIARNLLIDYYRKRDQAFVGSFDAMTASVGRQEANAHFDARAGRDTDLWAVDPGDLEADTMTRLTLERAGRTLTEQQATVMQLRWGEGYSFAEIGAMLGHTEGAAKALQYRALENMRRVAA